MLQRGPRNVKEILPHPNYRRKKRRRKQQRKVSNDDYRSMKVDETWKQFKKRRILEMLFPKAEGSRRTMMTSIEPMQIRNATGFFDSTAAMEPCLISTHDCNRLIILQLCMRDQSDRQYSVRLLHKRSVKRQPLFTQLRQHDMDENLI
jgi:hypothetical protein